MCTPQEPTELEEATLTRWRLNVRLRGGSAGSRFISVYLQCATTTSSGETTPRIHRAFNKGHSIACRIGGGEIHRDSCHADLTGTRLRPKKRSFKTHLCRSLGAHQLHLGRRSLRSARAPARHLRNLRRWLTRDSLPRECQRGACARACARVLLSQYH